MAHLIIGSPGNKLALSQSNWVKAKLERLHPGLLVGLEVIETEAAREAAWQAAAETALLARRVDCVLHKLRALPLELPLEFHLAAVIERDEPREALVVRDAWHVAVKSLGDLPDAARIGINSPARRAQLCARRRGWSLVELPLPLEQRLHQLGEHVRIATLLELHEVLPAASQGALALQSRLDDQRTNLLLEALNHWPTRSATEAERAVLRNLANEHGLPVAALAQIELLAPIAAGPQLVLAAMVADIEGRRLIRGEKRGPLRQAERLGSELAFDLLRSGAREFLQHAPSSTVTRVEELFPTLSAPSATITERLLAPVSEPQPEELTPATFALPPASQFGFERSAFTLDTAQEFDIVRAKARKARAQTPLHDYRVLIARATRSHAELVKALQTLGAQVVNCPTVRVSDPASWEPLDKALVHLSWYQWLTFASAPSVAYFLRRFDQLGHRRAEIEARHLCAIGAQTAARLAQAGLQCDLVLDRFTAECLAETVQERFGRRERLRGASLLLLASQRLCAELRPALNKFDLYVEAVETYGLGFSETGSAELMTELQAAAFHYVIFNGESSVENLAAVVEPQTLPAFLAMARVLCSNEGAQTAALAHGLKVHLQPAEANVSALVAALREDCLRDELDAN
jgi:hydroxymethylbilane synthase